MSVFASPPDLDSPAKEVWLNDPADVAIAQLTPSMGDVGGVAVVTDAEKSMDDVSVIVESTEL